MNSGPAQAARTLQRCLGLTEDGFIGEATLATVTAICCEGRLDDLITRYCDARLVFMKRLRNWTAFAGGWSKRVAKVKAGALATVPGGVRPVMLVRAELAADQTIPHSGSSFGAYAELDESLLLGTESVGLGDAKAEASETKITATARGKAAVVTGAAAAGNAGTEALSQIGSVSQSLADQIAPYTSALRLIGYLFAALTIIGVGVSLYLTVRSIAKGTPQ